MKLEVLRKKRGFICDMDGVVYHGNHLLPGAKRFVNWLKSENKKFLFLTNSSERSPRELKEKLDRLGISSVSIGFNDLVALERECDPKIQPKSSATA
jgi:ribonucleotide monophosphatase NagD (HAD superfamily)